jgi:hypothetical protein
MGRALTHERRSFDGVFDLFVAKKAFASQQLITFFLHAFGMFLAHLRVRPK